MESVHLSRYSIQRGSFGILPWCVSVLVVMGTVGAGPGSAQMTTLSITPITWNVIGLDSNKVSDGPDRFLVAARVTNTGSSPAATASATFFWDSANTYIDLTNGPAPKTIFRDTVLAVGATWDVYYEVTVTRNTGAWNTTRQYHIEAQAINAPMVSTPTPRELYVEKLVSQNRNEVNSITGATSVKVGAMYDYVMNSKTATGGYEQLVNTLVFPESMFQLVTTWVTYPEPPPPPPATNDKVYADACGWDAVPTSPNYRSCIGPANYTGDKAGGNPISQTYRLKVVSAGTGTLSGLIYDFSGSSYHYNSDYGLDVLTVNGTTAVGLVSFEGKPSAGALLLQWKTATEKDSAGFYLWKSPARDGEYLRITDSMIPAEGGTSTGASYSWPDPAVALGQTFFYKLEEVDSAGTSKFHGPIAACMGAIANKAPSDGATVSSKVTATFSWDSTPYDRFRIQFCSRPTFSKDVLTLPLSGKDTWIQGSQCTPRKKAWKKIQSLSGRKGTLYWRVYGEDQYGNSLYSDASRLLVR
ncbi:MAG: hypothetical protein AB1714_20330 [Acidobacteriota bacterium]